MPAAKTTPDNDAVPEPGSAARETSASPGRGGEALDNLRQFKRRLKWRLRGWPERFCLITGAPRSGTTALYEWLSGHEQVTAATESRILVAAGALIEQATRFKRLRWRREDLVGRARDIVSFHYGRRRLFPDRSIVIDKEPLEPIAFPDRRYGAFLKNMRILFPNVRFLFMVRDPLATVWSMRQRKWGYSLLDREPRAFSVEEHVENWCECAALALEYADDPLAYVCSFERLVSDSLAESRRIEQFLEIPEGKPFAPSSVKTVSFTDEEQALILEAARPCVEALRERGLWEPAE